MGAKLSPHELTVIHPGQPVTLSGDIPARVKGVLINGTCLVQYLCAWWDGRTRIEEWLEAVEVTVSAGTQGIKIGFTTAGNGQGRIE